MDSASDTTDDGMSILTRFLKLLQDICKKIFLALQHTTEKPQIQLKVSKPAEKKSKQTTASSHKRKNRKLRPWKQWLAQTARIKYSLPPSDPEESSFHLQNLFTISSDALKPIAGASKSQQSIQVNIFNMPPAKKAKIEENMKTEITSTIKVEIVNVAEKHKIEVKNAILPQEAKCFITPQSDVIDISDEEGENMDSNTEKDCKHNTCTALLETNKPKSSFDFDKQIAKIEIFDMPPLQKAKTEGYVKSQPTSSIKAEVSNPQPKESFGVQDLHRDPKTERTEKSTSDTIFVPFTSNNCEKSFVASSSLPNITLKIYNPPKEENANETRINGQESSIIQLEIHNASVKEHEETKSANKLKIKLPKLSDVKVNHPSVYKSSQTDFVTTIPISTDKTSSTLKSSQATQSLCNAKINKTSTLLQIPSASSKSSSRSSFPSLRMRQMELHRLRVQVEHKRLELLNLKLAREWHEMERLKITFDRISKTQYFDGIILDDVVDV